MSFIKLESKIRGKTFWIVTEDECYQQDRGWILEPQGLEYSLLVFANEEDAGQYVRNYWEEYIEQDPDEAVHMLGAENLIQWGLGRLAGPGNMQVRSLEEWLDLHLDCWHEHFEEVVDVSTISDDLEELLGFKPTIACVV